MPGTSNVVGWHLHRLTGRAWVAHFSDPWPPLQVTWKRWNWLAAYKWPWFHFWRRRFLAHADALTFTNPYQAEAVLGRNRVRYLSKSFVVTHLASTSLRDYQAATQRHVPHRPFRQFLRSQRAQRQDAPARAPTVS